MSAGGEVRLPVPAGRVGLALEREVVVAVVEAGKEGAVMDLQERR